MNMAVNVEKKMRKGMGYKKNYEGNVLDIHYNNNTLYIYIYTIIFKPENGHHRSHLISLFRPTKIDDL